MQNDSSDRLRRAARDGLRLLRVRHWVKNLLVFAPLLFSLKLTEPRSLRDAAAVFVAFCLGASGLYIVNDIADRERDRHHPRTRTRPIAAGRVPVAPAAALSLLLLVAGLAIAATVGASSLYTLAAYMGLIVVYSLVLKRVVILDVMCIAAGFLLRVIGGGVAIDVRISRWLLLTTFFLALFLGFCKRRREATIAEHDEHRVVLHRYSLQLLDVFIIIAVTLTIITYSLYVVDPVTIGRVGTDGLILTIPPAVFGLLRYLYLVYRKSCGGDPISAITGDRPIVAAALLWALIVVLVLYVFEVEKLL